MLEKTLESPLDSKEIQPFHSEGNQAWIFIGRTDAEAKTPILWPPEWKSRLIGKDPDAGKDWRRKEKGMTEDEMIEWHHWLSGYEFEQALGVGERQGSLACCSPWVANSWTWLSDWTELNWCSPGRENNYSPCGKQRMVLCCKTPQLDEDWLLETGDHIRCAVFLGALAAVQLSNLLHHPKSHKQTPMKATPCFWGLRLLFTDVSAGSGGCKASALFNSWFWQDVSG